MVKKTAQDYAMEAKVLREYEVECEKNRLAKNREMRDKVRKEIAEKILMEVLSFNQMRFKISQIDHSDYSEISSIQFCHNDSLELKLQICAGSRTKDEAGSHYFYAEWGVSNCKTSPKRDGDAPSRGGCTLSGGVLEYQVDGAYIADFNKEFGEWMSWFID